MQFWFRFPYLLIFCVKTRIFFVLIRFFSCSRVHARLAHLCFVHQQTAPTEATHFRNLQFFLACPFYSRSSFKLATNAFNERKSQTNLFRKILFFSRDIKLPMPRLTTCHVAHKRM